MTSTAPSILIHEYFSGGGWPKPELPPGLAAEGLAILRAVLTDFRAWGGAKITSTRDARLSDVSLPAERLIPLAPEDHFAVLEQVAGQCTAALIIAPESGGILTRLSLLMERRRTRLLGSSPAGVTLAGNKWDCHRLFTRAGLPTPDTRLVDLEDAMGVAEKMGFPLVIKPVDGVGCEGVNLVLEPSSLRRTLHKGGSYGNRFLLQRYIDGDHASASLLVAGPGISCLSLNRQFVKTGAPFSYRGGEVFFPCDKREEALDLAKRAAALVPGLKGYVGVDLVITGKGCYVIEINPRLTTAYIGLRRVVNINLAEAIWGAAIRDVLPVKISLSGRTTFRKDDLI